MNDYGLGWFVVNRTWADGLALTHGGSNTFNYALIWIAPNRNFGIVITTNIDNFQACDELAGKLISKYL